jgi:PAS domain S-box-containing protein
MLSNIVLSLEANTKTEVVLKEKKRRTAAGRISRSALPDATVKTSSSNIPRPIIRARDITQEKTSLEAATSLREERRSAGDIGGRKEEERERMILAAAAEQTAEGIAIMEPGGVVVYVNPAFCAATGYSKEELLKANIRSFVEGVRPEIAADIENTVGRNKTWSGRFQGKNKAGAVRYWDVRVSPIKRRARAFTGVVAVLRDVTAEAEMEAHVTEAQRLEAIGTLSGGIAHDFNNILAIILGNAELALDEVAEDSPIRQYLTRLVAASIRGRDLIKQIVAFGRGSAHHMRVVHLTPMVNETAKLLRSTLPAFAQLNLDLRAESDAVSADISQMQQVLINLATNASQAMPQGGELTIGLHNIDLKAAPSLPDAPLKAGRHLVLSVADTGKGMSEAVKQRIFEPFFTTKRQGEGTGLGLSVVYGIVMAHKGAITVKSSPGKGSTFRIFLPVAEKTPRAAAEGTSGAASAGRGRILFVDDEDSIAQMVDKMLSRLGYEVTTHTYPAEALDAFQRAPDAFDAVVTDQTMPCMTGLELARRLLDQRPDLPIVLCTGYSETVDEAAAEAAGIKAFLMKPLTRQELARSLARALKDKGWRKS